MWKLGSLESEVMEQVWSAEGSISVREMVDELNARRTNLLAYTTIMSTMTRLHSKGWLRRRRHGQQFLYEPRSSRDACSAAVMVDAFSESRDPESALLRFVENVTENGSPELQAALRRVLDVSG